MARRKQITPMQRIPSGEVMQAPPDFPEKRENFMNGHAALSSKSSRKRQHQLPPIDQQLPSPGSGLAAASQAGYIQLIVCVAGIYISFLSWALLQERITTTPYATVPDSFFPKQGGGGQEYFRFPVVLNTVQSLFASLSGSAYLFSTSRSLSVFPSRAIVAPLLLVSITSTLASPFGYASLAHVDYLTFVLAKSCKLLPVMALHITLFRKKYPISKYLIILAVTAGVAIFTIYHPPKSGSKRGTRNATKSSVYGLTLLGINLLLDGLTNSVQDHIFRSPSRYGGIITGPQMMVAQNLLSTVLMAAYLSLTPYIPLSLLPTATEESPHELVAALNFLRRHPRVLNDVLGFAACGAVGQLFIYATLERFSSLLLVTVTVTRKMLTMLLSVFWFRKNLTHGQWMGVALVFGGVGAEGWIAQQEKAKKAKMKKT